MLPGQAQEVEAGAGGDAALVFRVAAVVEGGRHLDPAEIRRVADTPDHRGDAGGVQVQAGGVVRCRLPHRAVGRFRRRVDVVPRDMLVDAGLDAGVGGVGVVEVFPEVVAEQNPAAFQVFQAPVQAHAFQGEAAQVDVAAAVAAGDVVVGLCFDLILAEVLAHRNAVVAHVVQPGDHVTAPVEARDPRRGAHRQVHLAAGQVQVLGDLAAGLAGAHHQHRSLGQGVRITIGGGVQLGQVVGQGVGAGRHLGLVVDAHRHDHPVGAQRAPVGAHPVAAAGSRRDLLHGDAFPQRRRKGSPEALHPGDDLVLDHEAVRVVAVIGVAGQPALPVRRDQGEAVPAFVFPGVEGLVLFQHQMVDVMAAQPVAGGQAGLAAAHHDHRVVLSCEKGRGHGGSFH